MTQHHTLKNAVTSSGAYLVLILALLVATSSCGSDTKPDSGHQDIGVDADSGGADALSDADNETPDSAQEDAQQDIAEADADATEPQAELSEALIAQFERMVEDEGYPSIVVGLIEGDASAVYGFGALGSGEAPDGQTLYEIGSVTKTFTALLLANAVESGELTLNDPVKDLLPGFEIPTRNEKEITLEHLATHHSGLPRMPAGVSALDAGGFGGDEMRDFLAGYSLPRDPGASYEYSNLGFGLLGYALGEHAGEGYLSALEDEILEPLGLASTYGALQDAPLERLAKGHRANGTRTANLEFAALAGAGSILSSADDMLAYLKANMGQGDSPLYPAMQLAHQARAGGSMGPNETGLAWMNNLFGGVDIIWHGGTTGGYMTFVGFVSDGSRGIVILTNILKPVDTIGLSVLLEGSSSDDGSIAMTPEALDEYVGDYKIDAQMTLTVYREGGQLMTQATGQGAFPIFPSAIDEFFAKIAPVSLSFERDESQQVVAVILHQNGNDFRAPRVPDE